MQAATEIENISKASGSTKSPDLDMEFEIEILTKDFYQAVSILNTVVERKNVAPILANIKFVVNGNDLIITSTDSDLSLSQRIAVQSTSKGGTTVAAKTLSGIIKHVTDETLKLKYVPKLEQLLIIGKSCQFNLATLPIKDFPTLEQSESKVRFDIEQEQLVKLVDNTIFSISTEETRYNLNGIYLHIFDEGKKKYFASASTDGHRLSLSYTEAPKNIDNFGIIMPKKAVTELQKMLKDSKSIGHKVNIDISNTKAKFTCNDITLISKLIDGNFPDYQAFIPKSNNNKLSIDTKQFNSAIERVAAITVEKFKAIKFQISNSGIEFSAFGEARGSASEQIKAIDADSKNKLLTYEGEDEVSIGFNPKYLTDVLDSVKGKKVSIELKDSFSPALIKDSDDPHSLFVVMPVKV